MDGHRGWRATEREGAAKEGESEVGGGCEDCEAVKDGHVHGCHLTLRVQRAEGFAVTAERTERDAHVATERERARGHK